MERAHLKQAVETLLFITDQPIGISKITQVLGAKDRDDVEALVAEIRGDYESRGAALQVLEIAEGYQMATRPGFAKYVRNLFQERMAMRLSTAALETLSIIAYKQPLTRAEVEEIRGVEVIAALETLLEKGLIRVTGRKESVGRPLLYGTTIDFLRRFGLRSLGDLPPLESLSVESPEDDVAVPGEGETAPPANVAGAHNEEAEPVGRSIDEIAAAAVLSDAAQAPSDALEDSFWPKDEEPSAEEPAADEPAPAEDAAEKKDEASGSENAA